MKRMTKFWRSWIKFRSLFIVDGPEGDRKRGKLYEPFLKSYGENFKVGTQAFIYNPNGLSVGNHVYIGFNSYLGQGEIEMGDEVLIGNFVSITASNHLRKEGSYRFGGYEPKKIVIGSGVWIAAHACIMAGVKVGKGSVIAAGSVLTKSVSENKVIGGVPGKEIKELE